MPRYLIVAHDTATSPELIDQVRDLARGDQKTELVMLVPSTPVKDLLLTRSSSDDAEAVARERADEARDAFRDAGVALADTVVGAASPRDAIADEVRRRPGYHGFVISCLPQEQSNWLRTDLPGEVERQHGLPVIRVELSPTQFDFWRRRSGWGRGV